MYEISAQFLGAVVSVAIGVAGIVSWIYKFRGNVEDDIEQVEENIESLEEDLEEDVNQNTEELKKINKKLTIINAGLLSIMEHNEFINADKYRNAMGEHNWEPEDFHKNMESKESA